MKTSVVILSLFCISFTCIAQVNNTYNLMPVPLELKTNNQRLAINQQFHLAIAGNPGKRLYAEASRFIRRMGEKTGFFLDKQGYVTRLDNDSNAPLLINVKREG